MKETQVLRSIPETKDECMKLPCGECGYSNDATECAKFNHT